MGIKTQLINLDPSKDCLKFLGERIESDKYRGLHLAQHYRYDVNDLSIVLEEFYKKVGSGKMAIRTTDLSKRPQTKDDEKVYAEYVNAINEKWGISTQDTVRKILFVDFHRMGLIKRFNKNGVELDPFDRKPVKYVSLSEEGIHFVENLENIFERNLIFTKKLDILLQGLPSKILDVVSISGKITDFEFMFFLSFMDCELNGHVYRKNELVEFISEFRSLPISQRNAAIDILNNCCDPSRFSGSKVNKRDFHNWKNETQTIFNLLNQTVYYELRNRNSALYILLGENSLFEDDSKLRRSIAEKDKYFEKHNIERVPGFELHHVIPLLTAKNRTEFATLDVWQNMVYIDGYTHCKITHTNNKNIDLEFVNDDITLIDPAGIIEDIKCSKGDNVIYNTENKSLMKDFNKNALNSL